MKHDWKYIKLGDIISPAKVVRNGANKKFPVLSITMRDGIVLQSSRFKKSIASVDTSDYKVVYNGQLVIAFPIDEGLIYTQDIVDAGIMSPAYNVWNVDFLEIDRKFLVLYLHCPFSMAYYKSKLRGTTMRRRSMPKEDLLNMPLPVPSFSVQQSIVSELDKINELIRLKKEQLKDYDNLAQSIFYEMFGDPVVNEKGWEVKKFSEVASFKNGLNFGKNENGYSYKILGVGDFKNNYVVNSSLLEYINLNDELSSDYFLKPEDIVFVRSNGSKELVGRCVSVDCTEPTTYSGFCIRCRLDENSGVLPMYLLYVCKNKGIREYLTQSGRGCNISNVNQKILNSTDIIIPPVSKQELFIQRIELIEQQKDEIKSTIADLETLLASRMQYWFD